MRRFYRAAQFASLGIEMAVAIVIGWAVGSWLDRRLGTDPWLMLVFLLFGTAAAFKGLIRTARTFQREQSESTASNPRNDSA